MANKPTRDWVYLLIIGLQLIGMLGTQPTTSSSLNIQAHH